MSELSFTCVELIAARDITRRQQSQQDAEISRVLVLHHIRTGPGSADGLLMNPELHHVTSTVKKSNSALSGVLAGSRTLNFILNMSSDLTVRI